jgi:acyl-CoA synthetase (AMP-forming)/AMP-acid ligase II
MDRGFSGVGRGLTISARRFPDKPALIEIDRLALTYSEMNRGANRLAHELAARGIRKGDHVAVLSENSIEHMVALYAIAKLGAVSVALDPRWTAHETARAITLFECRLLILDRALHDRLALLPPGTPELGTLDYDKSGTRCELLDAVAGRPELEPEADIRDHDLCTLILTSGTTGLPKGVMRTHRNVEMGCINGVLGKAQDETSRELAVVPLYYGSGRGSIIGQIYLGGTVYVMPRFDAERAAFIIDRENITAVALAPTMCNRLLKVPRLERFDFRSLATLRKAGLPFSLAMATEIISKITPNIYQGYASTESGSVSLLKPHEQLTKVGSSGRLVWGVEAEIADPDGNTLPAGGEGEIRVRGPNVCEGHYKNPEEQAKAFRGGWFYTGDVGRFDDDGYLYVVGRIKDFIKTGSVNVAPREVESAILGMAGIDDVAVVGISDPEWGEAVKAIVVVKDGYAIDKSDITRHCKQMLAGYKAPKYIEFTDRIERNALGKVTQEFKSRQFSGAAE